MPRQTHRTLVKQAEVEAYLHSTRMAILEALRDGPATSTHIAAKLQVHPANLTRHLRTLEEAGLIELVEKRDTGRNLEKFYEACATTFDVAPDADGLEAPHKIGIAFARSDLSAALAHLSDEDTRPVITLLSSARIAAADVSRFAAELQALVAAFTAADGKHGESYHLNVSLYPSDIEAANSQQIRLGRKGRRP